MLTQLLRRVEGQFTRQYKKAVKVTKKYTKKYIRVTKRYAKVSHKKIQKVNRRYLGRVIANSMAVKVVGYMALFVAISSGMNPAQSESQAWVSGLQFDKTQAVPMVLAQKTVDIKVVPIIPPAPVIVPAPKIKFAVQTIKPRTMVARERAIVPAPVTAPVANIDVKAYARARSDQMFGAGHWSALEALWARESGWNYRSYNRSSTACGIPQAMPCSKGGSNFRNDPQAQVEWGLRYIAGRYGNPSKAWAFWNSRHWY